MWELKIIALVDTYLSEKIHRVITYYRQHTDIHANTAQYVGNTKILHQE